jgi:hypothetical protein
MTQKTVLSPFHRMGNRLLSYWLRCQGLWLHHGDGNQGEKGHPREEEKTTR